MGLLDDRKEISTVDSNTHRAKSKTERYLIQKNKHNRALYSSLTYLVLIVIVTLIVDTLFFPEFTVTRSLALGAGLNWFSNAIFAKFVFRYTGAQAHRHIVHQLYIGQMIKWGFTLVGFALVFNYVRPISTFAVLVGYISMLVAQSIVLLRMR